MKTRLDSAFPALMLSLLVGLTGWSGDSGASEAAGMRHATMNHAGDLPGQTASARLSRGLAKKIDKARGRLTITHGPLENLAMPAMTMVFGVSNRALLNLVKPGDPIRFRAEMVNGALTVTQLEVVK